MPASLVEDARRGMGFDGVTIKTIEGTEWPPYRQGSRSRFLGLVSPRTSSIWDGHGRRPARLNAEGRCPAADGERARYCTQ